MMGPEDFSEEWEKQIQIIVTVAENAGLVSETDIDRITVMYAMDETFSRSAILEARKRVIAGNKNEQATNKGRL